MAQQGADQPVVQQPQVQAYRQPCLPEPFADDDISTWLRRFDLCCSANRWDAHDRVVRLPTLLQGRAFAVFERLTQQQMDTYDHLVAALKTAFEPRTEEGRRLATRQLNSRTLQTGEDLDVFVRDLERLLDRAQPGLSAELRRQQLIDRFIAGLPEVISDQLYVLAPVGLNGAVSKARELCLLQRRKEDRQGKGQGRIAATTGAQSADQESLAQTMVRSLEALTSRLERLEDRIQGGATGKQQSRSRKSSGGCFRCGSTGHWKRDCPVPAGKPTHKEAWKKTNSNPNSLTKEPQKSNTVGILTGGEADQSCSLTVQAIVAGQMTQCLVDTGASPSLVPSRLYLGDHDSSSGGENGHNSLKGVDGNDIHVCGKVDLQVEIGQWKTHHTFLVANIATGPILGVDFLLKHNITVDLRRRRLTLPGGAIGRLTTPGVQSNHCFLILNHSMQIPTMTRQLGEAHIVDKYGNKVCQEGVAMLEPDNTVISKTGVMIAHSLISLDQDVVPVQLMAPGGPVQLSQGTALGQLTSIDHNVPIVGVIQEPDAGIDTSQDTVPRSDVIPTNASVSEKNNELVQQFELNKLPLKESERKQLEALIITHANLFVFQAGEVGRTDRVQHRIKTGDSPPIRQHPRRLPHGLRGVVKDQVQEMLERDIIRPSASPWSSPIVLVKRRDGRFRFCVDYRKLNAVTTKDSYPLPRIDEALDSLSGAKYFSTLDLASGYWQVEVTPEDRPKTAFTSMHGLYEFDVMPFGLTNAPSTFQRLMEAVLAGLSWEECLIYLDDIIVFSSSFKEHMLRLERVDWEIECSRFEDTTC